MARENSYLRQYVVLVRKFNQKLITNTLVGVDINKELIEEKYKGKKTDLRTLQIVEREHFVMSGMNVGRDKRIPIALYMGDKPLGASGSAKYYVFKVKDTNVLLPEYLNLIFKKQLTDQIGLYFSGKGVRGELEWKNFSQMPISVPPLETQKRIVYKYQTVEKLIKAKRKLNELLEKWMQAYYHCLFDDLKEFKTVKLGELFSVIRGSRPPRSNKELDSKYFCKEGGIPWLQVRDISKQKFKFVFETSEQLTVEGARRCRAKLIPKFDPGGGMFRQLFVPLLEIQLEKLFLYV